MRLKLSIAEIKSTLSPTKRDEDKDTLLAYYFMRPISVYPAWLFLRWGMSANQATVLAFVVGLVACVLLGFGHYWAIIVGAFLINVRLVLDYSDGTVARATDNCTNYGKFCDRICDNIIAVFVPLAVGVGLYFHPDMRLSALLGVEIPAVVFLIMGLVYSMLFASCAVVSDEVALIFSIIPYEFYRPQAGKEWSLWGILYKTGINIQLVSTVLLLFFAVANALSLFLAFYILVSLSEVVVAVGKRVLTFPEKKKEVA